MRTVLFAAWPQFDPDEIAFWRSLSRALAHRDLRLVIASPISPPADLGVDHIAAVPSMDTWWRSAPAPATGIGTLGLDAAPLLAREENWGGPAVLPVIAAQRRRAIDQCAAYWLRALHTLRPALVVIWNGQHVSELVLDTAARAGGAAVLCVERGPFAGTLFVDEGGISYASRVAAQPQWVVPDDGWLAIADAVAARVARGSLTWWGQPQPAPDAVATRSSIGAASHDRIVLFAGQVEEDTQRFLFAPQFPDNVTAFEWLLNQLRDRPDVFVLGKHHPKSHTPPAAYARALAASGVRGTWRTDVAIDAALSVADRVAAVNSTVLYEGLARRIPALSLGNWLLSGRGAAYEVRDPRRDARVVDAWLNAEEHSVRLTEWRRALAFALSHCTYAYAPHTWRQPLRGADALASRFHDHAAQSWTPSQRILDDALRDVMSDAPRWRHAWDPRTWPEQQHGSETPEAWERAIGLRYQLLRTRAETRAGRRVVIWGAGEAGQIARRLLDAAGVRPAAFITSTGTPASRVGLPIWSPEQIRVTEDVVLVATGAAREIVPMLVQRGLVEDRDYHVLNCETLLESADAAVAQAC